MADIVKKRISGRADTDKYLELLNVVLIWTQDVILKKKKEELKKAKSYIYRKCCLFLLTCQLTRIGPSCEILKTYLIKNGAKNK